MALNNSKKINSPKGVQKFESRIEQLNTNRLIVKRLGIFADPEAFTIPFPKRTGREYQTFGAKIVSLGEVQRIAKVTSGNSQIARLRTLHLMAEYFEQKARQPISEPNPIIHGISGKPKNRGGGFAVISLNLDPHTADTVRAERRNFIEHFGGEKYVHTPADYSVTFARFWVDNNKKGNDIHQTLLHSGVVGRAVILGPAMADYPIAQL